MNPFAIYRNHTRLEDDMTSHYTDDKAAAYLESTDKLDILRGRLRHSATVLMALLAVTVAAYNLYRTFDNSNDISLIEMTFPFIAALCAYTLRLANHHDNHYWNQATKKIENAQHLRDIMNRPENR